MRSVSFDMDKKMDVVNVNGNPYMFTNFRVKRETIPGGMRAYDIADSNCDGYFCRAALKVAVDHWGTVIGPDELPLEKSGSYYCAEPDGVFLDHFVTAEEFAKEYDSIKEECQELAKEAETEKAKLRALPDQELLGRFFCIFEDETYGQEGFYHLIEAAGRSFEKAEILRRLDTDVKLEAYSGYIESLAEYASQAIDAYEKGSAGWDEAERRLRADIKEKEGLLRKAFS